MFSTASRPLAQARTYEVTFEADAACTDLLSAVRTRTNTASFASQGSSATDYFGTLSGADFARGVPGSYPGYNWNVLSVRVLDDVAQIFFSDPPIWEHLPPESDLVIEGDEAKGPVRADSSHWSFAGSFTYCPAAERGDSYPECEVPEFSCRSQNHQLTLTRK